jgi:hypothetical protein
MKPGAPVDRNRSAVDQISPAAQAVLRELRRRSILPDCHAAPVQRLHMHRPERLDRLVAFVVGQLEPAPLATSATLVVLGFGSDSGVLRADLGHLRICDRTQPTCKRRVREAVHPAVAALRQAAAWPYLDVHSPPLSTCRIFKMFCCHRRTSHERRNPIWNDSAPSEGRARLGRLLPPIRTAR